MKQILIALTFFTTISFAQNKTDIELPKIEFGKIQVADFKARNAFDKDSAAHAIVLYEKGEYTLKYENRNGFTLHTKVHQRIKILDKTGVDVATQTLVYTYNPGGEQEEIIALNGYTFSVVNDVLKKEKLEKTAIFKEKVAENRYTTKFTMPNVQPGSIIDIEYIKTSNYETQLGTWWFQTTKMPVLWSVLETNIPIYYNFKASLTGFYNLDYIYNDTSLEDAPFLGTSNGASPTYTNVIYRCAMKNMPPLDENTFTNRQSDYLSHIQFDLASFHPPYSYSKEHAKTWESVADQLLDYKFFGEQLKGGGFMEDDIVKVVGKAIDPYEQMQNIFSWVKSALKANDNYGVVSDETIKTIYKNKTGNATGINLLLCNALRQRGFDANMLLISTRSHGRVRLTQPSFSAFDRAVVRVVIAEKTYLLDASDPFATPNCLPKECLHNKGLLIINAKKLEWIDPSTKERSVKQLVYDLKMDKDGTLTGKQTMRFTNYEAVAERKKIKNNKTETEYRSALEKQYSGLSIKSMTLKDVDSLRKTAFAREMEIEIRGRAQLANDMIYYSFLPFEAVVNNPFKAEKRVSPLHFDYIAAEDVMVRTALPEGYKVEELPKNLSITSPNGELKLTIFFKSLDTSVECISKFSSNNLLVSADEYTSLREWYNQVIAKHAEPIVLKKK
jgi:Domain of Unknown Function with PDB structure (DUF3857)